MKRFLLALAFVCFAAGFAAPTTAQAATCFWVGGTGNWDNTNTASWASSSGGSASSCASAGNICRASGDTCTFDGSSGGGTVTVCGAAAANCPGGVSGNISLVTIVASAFTGTLDFSAINPAVTLTTAFTDAGTGGTHTVNMGSGAWTFTGGAPSFDVSNTNLTLNKNTSTISMTATQTSTRGLTLGTKNIGPVTLTGTNGFLTSITGAATIDTLTINAPSVINIQASTTLTVGTLTINGTASNAAVELFSNSGTAVGTLSISTAMTAAWGVFKKITFAGAGSFSITNSVDLGGNSGATIGGITTGGGGIIGG